MSVEARVLDILVVDDQPGVRQLIRALCSEEGHRVHMAANGQEAVAATRAVHPDLVFMDVRMPVMDGLEALPLIREIQSGVVVAMMTAFSGDHDMSALLADRSDVVMNKPFDLDSVRGLIRRVALCASPTGVVEGCWG